MVFKFVVNYEKAEIAGEYVSSTNSLLIAKHSSALLVSTKCLFEWFAARTMFYGINFLSVAEKKCIV